MARKYSFYTSTPEKDFEDLKTYFIRYYMHVPYRNMKLEAKLNYMKRIYNLRLNFINGHYTWYVFRDIWYVTEYENIPKDIQGHFSKVFDKNREDHFSWGGSRVYKVVLADMNNYVGSFLQHDFRDLEYFKGGLFETVYKELQENLKECYNIPTYLFLSGIKYMR